MIFILYISDQLQLIKRYQLRPYTFADDTQNYGFCRPTSAESLRIGVYLRRWGVTVDNGKPVAAQPYKNRCHLLLFPRREHLTQPDIFVLTIHLSHRSAPSETSEVTSMLTLLSGPTSSHPSDRALQRSGRATAYDVTCLVMPCWL